MNTLIKLALVWLLAPALLVTLLATSGVLLGVALFAALITMALLIGGWLGYAAFHMIRTWAHNRFSPVRRRYPRPAAWYQWR